MCPTSNLVWSKSVKVVCRNTLETVLVTQKAITQLCKNKVFQNVRERRRRIFSSYLTLLTTPQTIVVFLVAMEKVQSPLYIKENRQDCVCTMYNPDKYCQVKK